MNNIMGSTKGQITKGSFLRQRPDARQSFGGQQTGVENLRIVRRRITEANFVFRINRSFEITENKVATAARHLQITIVPECLVPFNERPRCKRGRHDHWRALRRKEAAALPREVITPGSTTVALNSPAP